MNKQQGFSMIAVIIIILVIVAGGLYVYQKNPTPAPVTDTDVVVESSNVATDSIPPAGWQTYRNNEYGFQFYYPATWKIYEPKNSSEVANVIYDTTGSPEAVIVLPQSDTYHNRWSFTQTTLAGQAVRDTGWVGDAEAGSIILRFIVLPSGITLGLRVNPQNEDMAYYYHRGDQILSTFKFTK